MEGWAMWVHVGGDVACSRARGAPSKECPGDDPASLCWTDEGWVGRVSAQGGQRGKIPVSRGRKAAGESVEAVARERTEREHETRRGKQEIGRKGPSVNSCQAKRMQNMNKK